MGSEWSVKFDREGEPGKEINMDKHFQWGGYDIYIPAAYVCAEGLVLDLCTEIDREVERRFLEKWVPRIREGLSKQESQQLQRENPLAFHFYCDLWINGEQLKNWHGSSSHWIPQELRPEEEHSHGGAEDYLDHYGLEKERVWVFQRIYYGWTDGVCEFQSIKAQLRSGYREFPGECFQMPEIGASIVIPNPLTGQSHTLTVEDVQRQSVSIPERFAEYDMPSEATAMIFRLEPDIPSAEFQLKDTQERDQARKKDGTPYNSGTVGLMLRMPNDGTHVAVSSMRFKAPETVIWEPVFRKKTAEDVTVTLL